MWTCLNSVQPTTYPDRTQMVLFITLDFVRVRAVATRRCARTRRRCTLTTAKFRLRVTRCVYNDVPHTRFCVVILRSISECVTPSAIFNYVVISTDWEVIRCVFNSVQQSSTLWNIRISYRQIHDYGICDDSGTQRFTTASLVVRATFAIL